VARAQVWIGEVGLDSVDWSALRELGLYVIYYQSEPRRECKLDNQTVDEMCVAFRARVHSLSTYLSPSGTTSAPLTRTR
jgi:hypothetical protein